MSHLWHTFWQWMRRSSDKSEKLEFKSQREAAEFVRRLYNENGTPNKELRALYRRGMDIQKNGVRPKGTAFG